MFKIKNSSDGRESVPSKKRRRRSRSGSHLFSCADSSDAARERSNTSDEKATRDQYVSSNFHKQRRKDSASHSKTSRNNVPLTRTLESVATQDLKVTICDSQEELERPLDDIAARFISDTDVIPSSLNSQEQQKLLDLNVKTSVNNFPVMRKMESVTQVDLELNTVEENVPVPSQSRNQLVSRDRIQKKSKLKSDNESCKKNFQKVSQNREVIYCYNTSIVNLDDYPDKHHVDSKGKKTQPFIPTSKSGKKQTLSGMKDGKCSPVIFPSVNETFPQISPKKSFYPALEFTSPISRSKKSLHQKETAPVSVAISSSVESPVEETESISSAKLNRNSLAGQTVAVSKVTCPTLKESTEIVEIDIVPDPKAAVPISQSSLDLKETVPSIQSSMRKDKFPSAESSMGEAVMISSEPELSEHPSKYSYSVSKVSQIKIDKNVGERLMPLKIMEEMEHVVPVLDMIEKHSEELFDNRTIIPPSQSPDEEFCGSNITEISRPVSTSLGEELLGFKSAIHSPANQEECNSVNVSQNSIDIAVSQLQKTGIDPEMKHCNSAHVYTEVNCSLVKRDASAASALAATNVSMLNVTKPLPTLSYSNSFFNDESSQDLLKVAPLCSKFCAKITEKGNVVNISKTCSGKLSKKLFFDLNKSSEIEIFSNILDVETDGRDCIEILTHLHSENKATDIEASPIIAHENRNRPRPSLVSTLKILAEYPVKSPGHFSAKRKRNEEKPDRDLPSVRQAKVRTPSSKKSKAGTPSSKRQNIPYPFSDHSSENTPSKTLKFEGKLRNNSRKKKLFDTSSFEILQDSPPAEENLHTGMHSISKGNEPAKEEELQIGITALNEMQINGTLRTKDIKRKKSIFTQKKDTVEKKKLQSKKPDGKRKSSRENEIRLESVDSFEKCSKSSIKKKKEKSNLEVSGGFLEYPEIEDTAPREHSVYSDYSSSGVDTEHSWMYQKKSKISDVSKTYPNKGKPLDRSHSKSFSSNEEWKPFKERKRKSVLKEKHSSPVKSKQELIGKRPIRESKRRSCKEGISYLEKDSVIAEAETPKKLKLYYYMSDKKATKSRDMEPENPVSPEILRHSGSSVDSGKSNYLDFQLSQKVKRNKKSLLIPAEAKISGNEISRCFESFSEIEDISYGDVSGVGIEELSHNTLKQRLCARSVNELEFSTTEVEIHASGEVIHSNDLIHGSEALGKKNINISEISEILVPAETKSHIACSGPLQSTLIQDENTQIPATGRFSYIADAENSSLYQENNSDVSHCERETTNGGDLRLPESISSFGNDIYLQFDNLEVSSEISKGNESSYKKKDLSGRKETFLNIGKQNEPVGEAYPVIRTILLEDAEVVVANYCQDIQGVGRNTNSLETHCKLTDTSKEKEVAKSVKYVSAQEVVSSGKVMLPVDRETADTNLESLAGNHSGSTASIDNSVNQQGGTSSIVVSTGEFSLGKQSVEPYGELCVAATEKESLVECSHPQDAIQSCFEKCISTVSPDITHMATFLSPDTTNMNDVPPNTPASSASGTPLGQVLQLLDKLTSNGFQDFARGQIVSPTSRVSDQTPTRPPPRQLFYSEKVLNKDGRSADNQSDVSHLKLLKFLTKFSSDDGAKFMNHLNWFSGSLKNVVSSLKTATSSLDTFSTYVDEVISDVSTWIN